MTFSAGIVPGGGVAYIRAIEGSIVVQKVKEGKADFGFNARTEVYENLLKAGVYF